MKPNHGWQRVALSRGLTSARASLGVLTPRRRRTSASVFAIQAAVVWPPRSQANNAQDISAHHTTLETVGASIFWADVSEQSVPPHIWWGRRRQEESSEAGLGRWLCSWPASPSVPAPLFCSPGCSLISWSSQSVRGSRRWNSTVWKMGSSSPGVWRRTSRLGCCRSPISTGYLIGWSDNLK